MESLHKFRVRGEANNTGDLLRAALLLGRAGYLEYFGAAERILRSHLLPSQLVDVSGYSDDPDANEDRMRRLARRARGGFGFPTPSDLQFQSDAPLFVYDIVSGAVDALCEAYRAIATEEPAGIRVNLLLDVETPGVSVRSLLSREGRIELRNRSRRNLFLRIPGWVPASAVGLEVAGRRRELRFVGPCLLLPDEIGDQPAVGDLPAPRRKDGGEHCVSALHDRLARRPDSGHVSSCDPRPRDGAAAAPLDSDVSALSMTCPRAAAVPPFRNLP